MKLTYKFKAVEHLQNDLHLVRLQQDDLPPVSGAYLATSGHYAPDMKVYVESPDELKHFKPGRAFEVEIKAVKD